MTEPRRYRKRIPALAAGAAGGAVLAPPRAPVSRRQMGVLAALLLLLLLVGGLLLWQLWPSVSNQLPRGLGGRAQNIPDHVFNVPDLSRPLGVAVSPDGDRVYVAETDGEHDIRVLDRRGDEIGKLVPPNTTPNMRLPSAVAVAPNGDVYVIDVLVQQLQVFSADGQFLRTIPPPDAKGWVPKQVTVDQNGQIYVTEAMDEPAEKRHRVIVMDSQGNLVRQFGSKGMDPGQLNYPYGIAVGSDGKIYVGSLMGGVQVFNADGTFWGRLGVGLGGDDAGLSQGLAVSADGDKLFVVDAVNHQVLVYRISGSAPEWLASFGEEGDADSQMLFPAGVATDSTGRVYVADRANNRLSAWSY